MTRTAIVTGAASGIGRATAGLLTRSGIDVALLDRAPIDDERSVVVDISDATSVTEAVGEARARLGAIDILVDAAGIAAAGTLDGERFVETWDETLAVNLTGAMLMVRACRDDLVRSEAGRIVNVASTEGLAAAPLTMPYTVSKHGVIGFTRSLAVELGPLGVTANCVCPGATLTGMTDGIPADARDKYARRNIPIGRYGRPEEIAFLIVALTSPDATFVNGAVIPVDGGMTAKAH